MNLARKSGMKQLIYLIEGDKSDLNETNRKGSGDLAMKTAINETQLFQGFIIHETRYVTLMIHLSLPFLLLSHSHFYIIKTEIVMNQLNI